MTSPWRSILCLAAVPSIALAQWQGWPVPTNASFYSVDTNHYVAQLYSGLVERCTVAGVSVPTVVDVWTNFGGVSNTVVVTNGVTITNLYPRTIPVTVTNVFLPFEYTYVDPVSSNTVTNIAYPRVKRSWFTTWDTTFDSLVGSFVITNGSGTNYNTWFGTMGVSNLGTSATPPMWTKTNLFLTLGIGYVTNTVAQWTHTPGNPYADWLLAGIWASGKTETAWTFKAFTEMGTNMHPRDASVLPVAQYIPAGAGTPTNLAITLGGKVWNSSGTGLVSQVETITFTDGNPVTLTYAWESVTGITCTATRPNSNDAIRITYTNHPALYAGVVPFRMYSATLNERWKALDTLRWTYKVNSAYTFTDTNTANGPDNSATGWAQSMASTDATWPRKTLPFAPYGTCGTFARFESGYYYASRIQNMSPWTTTATPQTTNFACAADFYWYSAAIVYGSSTTTGNVWNAIGTPLLQDQYALIGSNTTCAIASSIAMTGSVGTTNKPSWCADPRLMTNGASFGYNAHYNLSNPGITIFRWDASTNGLRYVQ
jgi:hypothetical protein